MRRTSMFEPMPVFAPAPRWRRALLSGTAFACLLAGCAVEVQNLQPARELARLGKPPGSVYTGWRVYQDKCAACHGPAGAGTQAAPDLLPRVSELGPRQFLSLVLQRYDSYFPLAAAGSAGATREALIDSIVRRDAGVLEMLAWQGEPGVSAHVADLYSYLSARAEGTQGPGRPTR